VVCVELPTASSLTLWYLRFWNTQLKSKYLRSSILEKFVQRSLSRLSGTERMRHAFPLMSEPLLRGVSSLFLNCYPLRKLIPFVINLGFFFDRMVEYSIALGNAPIHDGEIFLDIGSGYGFFPSYLASHSRTICLDIDRDVMIYQKEASKSVSKTVPQSLECVVADCTKLPFKNESFSEVFVISTIEHIEQDKIVAKESGRVLKRNGKCVISFPFSKLARDPQIRPYFQRFYTREDIRERIISPSLLSLEELENFRKTFVSLFYSIVPEGWLIFKDLVIGLTLFKMDKFLLPRNYEGALSIVKLRKDFEKPQENL
jgi:ubiquinone/menaquinone biosynthesis C-methylase UbiE